ncbi:palmitoyltransferase ZDHHC6-like [Amphiura filiformis]|uniref:palmitoyltransferase ZDHHC6-like n=1 Tax=Amphiura filiformis TaxID=82378 RepID=UPI003B21C935
MCFGPLRRLCHWGPWVALFLIFYITMVAIYCDLVMWPPTTNSYMSIINFIILSQWIFLILYNYFWAVFEGPGFVPKGWRPANKEDEQHLQFCRVCQGFKAPRSHHCRHCQRCVMKMDHHCPWINTCCGHKNHAHFTYFLIVAPLGCLHGAGVFLYTIYVQLYKHIFIARRYRQIVRDFDEDEYLLPYGFPHLFATFIGLGFSLGVSLAVLFLFYTQIRSIWKNETGIESWIVAKARVRHKSTGLKYVYPYHLGVKENLRQVFTWEGVVKGDGITWPVVQGCDQYSLTREQIAQKEVKKQRTLEYIATEDYSGSWFPITKGCCTCIRIPMSDEPRIRITERDIIMVTRWKKYWLYGEIVLTEGHDHSNSHSRVRGWFPKRCAIQNVGEEDTDIDGHEQKKTK